MRVSTRIVVVCVCLWGCAGGVGGRHYEPYVFAAVPLHAPVPVLRVLSPAPFAPRPRPRPRPRTTPYTEQGPYAESRPYADIRPYSDSRQHDGFRPFNEPRPYESRPYSSGRPYVETVDSYEESAAGPGGEVAVEWAPASDSVLYARPSPAGGYLYRAGARGPPERAALSHDHPVIIKIHKHRITRS